MLHDAFSLVGRHRDDHDVISESYLPLTENCPFLVVTNLSAGPLVFLLLIHIDFLGVVADTRRVPIAKGQRTARCMTASMSGGRKNGQRDVSRHEAGI